MLFLNDFKLFTDDIFAVLNSNLTQLSIEQIIDYIAKYQNTIIKEANKEIISFKKKYLNELKDIMLDVL
ncbi:MAG: hypothetical protein JXL97_19335 [Bacteroidales bacterium]|nr:hypothetical protein [Bacteroidales bacterium]